MSERNQEVKKWYKIASFYTRNGRENYANMCISHAYGLSKKPFGYFDDEQRIKIQNMKLLKESEE